MEDTLDYVNAPPKDDSEFEILIAMMNEITEANAELPLVVGLTSNNTRCYYFWFFGYVVKLPYERELVVNMKFSIIKGGGQEVWDEGNRPGTR